MTTEYLDVIKDWNELAKEDALWAVLTDDAKGVETETPWTDEEFFATGEKEIARIIQTIEDRKLYMKTRKNALDFGCGVGRLSRALAKRFENVHGVDGSKEMIKIAKEKNPGINFHLNEVDDLSLFKSASFDLIVSHITLQHIPKEAAKKYIQEFVRLVAPMGVIVFEMPSAMISEPRDPYKMQMNTMSTKEVTEALHGSYILRHDRTVTDDTCFAWDTYWVSKKPLVIKTVPLR